MLQANNQTLAISPLLHGHPFYLTSKIPYLFYALDIQTTKDGLSCLSLEKAKFVYWILPIIIVCRAVFAARFCAVLIVIQVKAMSIAGDGWKSG
jgi:hypothetical protein